jgi:hypothetical protein
MSASDVGELAEQVRQLALGHRAVRDLDHREIHDILVLGDAKAIHVEKHDGGQNTGALVSVDERCASAM